MALLEFKEGEMLSQNYLQQGNQLQVPVNCEKNHALDNKRGLCQAPGSGDVQCN